MSVDAVSLVREFDDAIDQLETALRECPDELWGSSLWEVKRTDPWIWPANNQPEPGRTDESIQVFSAVWVVAYHCLFYLDFYVTTETESFQTPEYIRGGVEEDPINEHGTAKFPEPVYPRELLLKYVDHGRERVRRVLASLTDDDLAKRCPTYHPQAGKTLAELLQVNLAHVREHGSTDPRLPRQTTQEWIVKRPPIVRPDEWEAARQQLLVKEKELTRARDALAAQRRRMPWLAVEKEYAFEGPKGKEGLLDLFDGRRQLIVYRAFFEPGVHGWPDHACIGCSMLADQVAHVAHLHARDTTLVFTSRAPQADIERLKQRMGWEMPWYTLTDDFDADFGVDEWHGTNAFIRDDDGIFRTYFINNRGDEAMGSTWNYLDITALGRQEEWEDSPEGYPQTPPYQWWIWHDDA